MKRAVTKGSGYKRRDQRERVLQNRDRQGARVFRTATVRERRPN
jgi:hypothetical protein